MDHKYRVSLSTETELANIFIEGNMQKTYENVDVMIHNNPQIRQFYYENSPMSTYIAINEYLHSIGKASAPVEIE